MFHLSHFHRLVSFCWFGFGCWGGFVCFAVAFLLSTDQSVRSSCQPMTSLAYLHDCHSRYDERSNVQKKTVWFALLETMSERLEIINEVIRETGAGFGDGIHER